MTSPNGAGLMRGFCSLIVAAIALSGLVALTAPAHAGCGDSNPNCIVPTAANGTNNNQAASTAFVQNAFAGGSHVPLPSANILVGNVSNVAAAVAMAGDCSITNAGAITCLKTGGVSFAPSATTDTTNAGNISSGTLAAARLPNPTASTLGGVESIASFAHNWVAYIDTLGVPHQSQPTFSDLSGTLPCTGFPALTGNVTTSAGACATTLAALPTASVPGTPTWTGLHTWTSGGIALTGAPPLSGTFAGSGGSANFWLNQSGAAASATVPELGSQFTLTSNVGSANKTTAYKIGLTSSVVGSSNSANIYAANMIVQGFAGSGQYLVTGIESDLNNVGTDATSALALTGAPAAFNFVAANGGSAKVTAQYWAAGGVTAPASPHYGFASGGNVVDASFFDSSNAANILQSVGGGNTHQFGINLFSAVLTGGTGSAFISPNNVGFGSANAAGNATIPLLNLDGSNVLQYGSTAVIKHQFNVNPGATTAAVAMINSHATSGDILLQLQGGAATAVDTTTLYLNMVNAANSVQRGQIIAADSGGVGHVAYQTASDERLKKSLGLLDDALDRLMQIAVLRYQAPNYEGDDYDVGFFAQNLYRAYPWAVTPSSDPDFHKHPWQVDYGRVTPLLVASAQEMQHEIDDLRSRLGVVERRSGKGHHNHPQ